VLLLLLMMMMMYVKCVDYSAVIVGFTLIFIINTMFYSSA